VVKLTVVAPRERRISPRCEHVRRGGVESAQTKHATALKARLLSCGRAHALLPGRAAFEAGRLHAQPLGAMRAVPPWTACDGGGASPRHWRTEMRLLPLGTHAKNRREAGNHNGQGQKRRAFAWGGRGCTRSFDPSGGRR